MFKAMRYVRTLIDGEQIKQDGRNTFRVCSVSEYKGKPEKNIPAGTTFDLQVMYDDSAPTYDKDGKEQENNLYEMLRVTIPGHNFATNDIKKGDAVALGAFMPEISYYINYSLILRYDGIQKLQQGKGQNAGGTKA